MDNCQRLHKCVSSIRSRLAQLHKHSDFIALVSIVINKVMDIEEQYSGWNHFEHTLLISPE
jgi:hypothetical protein